MHDDTKWRKLTHSVLQQTRHELPMVRSASLRIVQKLYSTLGEAFLVLLPETVTSKSEKYVLSVVVQISYLAELLEDDEADIERDCREFIKELEELSGESLQEQFT